MSAHAKLMPALHFPEGHNVNNLAWRFTLLTGLIPGALILFMMPFVPESGVWKRKKQEGTLKRAGFGELFSRELRLTTIVTTILSACGYAAAFGAIQMTPLQIVAGLPDMAAHVAEEKSLLKDAEAKLAATKEGTPQYAEAKAQLAEARKAQGQFLKARRGDIQRWQEIGGLVGRILLALLLLFVSSRTLIRLFLVPGVILFPVTYFRLVHADYTVFAIAIFFCGLLTVAQFSFLSEFLPRVFPMHLRGTGGSFATNSGRPHDRHHGCHAEYASPVQDVCLGDALPAAAGGRGRGCYRRFGVPDCPGYDLPATITKGSAAVRGRRRMAYGRKDGKQSRLALGVAARFQRAVPRHVGNVPPHSKGGKAENFGSPNMRIVYITAGAAGMYLRQLHAG